MSELAQKSQTSASSATPPPAPTRPTPDTEATTLEPTQPSAEAAPAGMLGPNTAPAPEQHPPQPTPSYPNPLALGPPTREFRFVTSESADHAAILVLGFRPEDYGLRDDTIYAHLDDQGHWVEVVTDAPDCVLFVQKGAEAMAIRPADGFLGTRILMERAGTIQIQPGCNGALLRLWELRSS